MRVVGRARKEGVDFLLAIGGGSVIDTAKAIGMGVPYDGDFWDFFTGKAKIERTLPVGTVLTISAAGSEGSDSCVITQENGRHPTQVFRAGSHLHLFPAGLSAGLRRSGYAGPSVRTLFHQYSGCSPD